MIQNFISMNGYGLFVWLSFAITFLACAIIYYKTYKTLKKYEKDFKKSDNRPNKISWKRCDDDSQSNTSSSFWGCSFC